MAADPTNSARVSGEVSSVEYDEGTKDTENSKNKPLVQTKNDWRWKGKKTIESATNEKFMNGACDS